MSEGRVDFSLFAASSFRDEKRQDDILQAFENYVKNDESTFAEIEKLIGLKLESNDADVKLEILLATLDDAHRNRLKKSIDERLKLPDYQLSKGVATKTYWDSFKASTVPALVATVIAGPFVGIAVGGATFSVHQGGTQLSHRSKSRERAEELLGAILRIEKVTKPQSTHPDPGIELEHKTDPAPLSSPKL